MQKPNAHALDALIQALRVLPGVGAKSASRMAFHLMQHERSAALHLAKALEHACDNVKHCATCHTLTETDVCSMCADPERDRTQLCVVETPMRTKYRPLKVEVLSMAAWSAGVSTTHS